MANKSERDSALVRLARTVARYRGYNDAVEGQIARETGTDYLMGYNAYLAIKHNETREKKPWEE